MSGQRGARESLTIPSCSRSAARPGGPEPSRQPTSPGIPSGRQFEVQVLTPHPSVWPPSLAYSMHIPHLLTAHTQRHVYTRTRVPTHACLHRHRCTHAHVPTQRYVRAHAHMSTQMPAHVYTCTPVHICHMHTDVCTCACIHAHVPTHVHMPACTETHVYTCTRAHTLTHMHTRSHTPGLAAEHRSDMTD